MMRYLDLLKRREILYLWLGQLGSTAGDRLVAMALLWITFELTGSSQQMAVVSLLEAVPYVLVGLIGGTLIDRTDRLRLMIRVDLLRAVIVLLIPVAHVTGGLQPLHLALVALALGGLGALFNPALESTMPGMVTAAEMAALSGLVDTTNRLARILGPGLAGLLLTFIPPVHFFTLDSATFLLSALCLTSISRRLALSTGRLAADRTCGKEGLVRALAAGWQITFRQRSLLVPLLVDSINNLAWAAFTLGAPILAVIRLRGSMGSYGLLIGAYGVGSLVGNVLTGNTGRTDRLVQMRLSGWGVVGLGFTLLGLAPNLPLALGASALAGLGGAVSHVSRTAAISLQVEGSHLGKVFSLQRMFCEGAGSLGLPLAGWALTRLDAAQGILIAGLTMGLTCLSGLGLLGEIGLPTRSQAARRMIR